MVDVSVIIPARNERFLCKTIRDIVEKSKIDTEVIAMLEGYWPDEDWTDDLKTHPKVHYVHFSAPRGMRGALNAGVALARGKFVMKLDAHCMVSEGFDEVLANVCRDNWVCVPTRHRLDPENWRTNDGHRHPINYLYLNNNGTLDGKLWNQKNAKTSLDTIRIDDLIAMQGSCYFMTKEHWLRMGLLDVEHYGTFRKDPQEVIFKTWTSGGRCVRVKDCWYAHLHKGKKYGRGYHASRTEYRKGDEYVKKWFTDEAWDERQKMPFKELIQKFPDMPGWHDHPWFNEEDIKAAKEKQVAGLPRTYQYLEVNGEPFTRPRPERTHSRFWNQGKWDNFIKPLLPEDPTDMTLVEMGANVGLFLKLAKDYGFRNVIGIEKDKTPVKIGNRYRDTIGYDYTLLKRSMGGKFGELGSFDIDELPAADITLMSTFHYHIDINAWYKYLERLRTKTCYALLVSVPDSPRYAWRVNGHLGYLKKYFDGWELVKMIDDVPEEGDSSPRKLFSVLFKSPCLRRVNIEKVQLRQGNRETSFGHLAIRDLTERVIAGDDIDIVDTEFYREWKRRKPRWAERTTRVFCQGKLDLVRGIVKDGLKDPILVQKDTLKLADGSHRIEVMDVLGYKTIIARELP